MCYRSSNFAQTSDRIVVLKVVPCVITQYSGKLATDFNVYNM